MWITYPGDAEVWLGNAFNNRRTERGAMLPPFWKQDSHYVTVEFSRRFSLAEAETVGIECEGRYNVALDGHLRFGEPKELLIPAGEHKVNIKVWCQATPPSLRVEGSTIRTDRSWLATYEDKMWIDENGVAHGSGIYVAAEEWGDEPPSRFALATRPEEAVSVEDVDGGRLYDFGRETMGYVVLDRVEADTTYYIHYGESREEALDHDHSETLDVVEGSGSITVRPYIVDGSKAFRYVHVVDCPHDVVTQRGASAAPHVSMLYEYLPFDESLSGAFECSDAELTRIWQVSARTLDLTTREFFMDGIKRDRWTWSGDAVQSYLMNYYLRFDSACVRRTIRQLRGKDPVTAHINTILDYTFYWFRSVWDYYTYTADRAFVGEMYPRMATLMDYVLSRTDEMGFAPGLADDWVFVDWVDFPMHKRGVLCFEQILFAESLGVMARAARLLGEDATRYAALEAALRRNTDRTFWDEGQGAYLHAIEDGEMNRQVTKFPNMMAIIYGHTDPTRTSRIKESVMLNPSVEPITTPYMRFYELDSLCLMGEHERVLGEMKAYWGGMLREGATSFWEKYNPGESGHQHLAMYGRPYGKSLCHAWGASPLYLIGKHYLGIRPTAPGYERWECRPNLASLEWLRGRVPTPNGPIEIYADRDKVEIQSPIAGGTLYVFGREIAVDTTEKIVVKR